MGKYKRDKGLQIPMEQRQKLNAKILYLVENHEAELYGITPEDIFNVYMGNGGLHGLDRKDFQNFHAYTEAKKEVEQGQFFTPAEICEFLVACVKPETEDIIYDLTYGKGDFFNYLPTESNIYGTEIDMKAVKIAQYLYPKANLQYGDIRQYSCFKRRYCVWKSALSSGMGNKRSTGIFPDVLLQKSISGTEKRGSFGFAGPGKFPFR